MLPKRSRLSKQTIEKQLIRARRIKTSRFLVMYTNMAGVNTPQVSFSVSKKVANTAVLRNRLRRRGYASVEALIPSLSPRALVLVSYLTPETETPIKDLTLEIKGIFEKAGLLK